MQKVLTLTTLFLIALSGPGFAQNELFARLNTKYDNIKVLKVVSADTIILENEEKIRMIGLKAPKPPKLKEEVLRDKYGFVIEQRASPIIPIEERAFQFALELLQDKTVRLEFDRQKRGEDFVSVAYVFLGNGTMVNAEILREGYADLRLKPPNLKYAEKLREAYREARREKKGLQGE